MDGKQIIQYIIFGIKWLLLVVTIITSIRAYTVVTKAQCGEVVFKAIKLPMILVILFNSMSLAQSSLQGWGMMGPAKVAPAPVIVQVAAPAAPVAAPLPSVVVVDEEETDSDTDSE
tara:strand:+ start:1724 stop:2071 length:348 start_codon:yes stop_codon:yes gene_type:complete